MTKKELLERDVIILDTKIIIKNSFKIILKKLKDKYKISTTDVLNLVQKDILIPSSIFINPLSPLEAEVKYLKENLSFDYSKIADLLGRNKKTIWQAYKNAVKKFPGYIGAEETEYNIPVSVFKTKLSILEAAAAYMKEKFNLSYHQIGELLHRNEKTIWTVYHRAQKKREHGKR